MHLSEKKYNINDHNIPINGQFYEHIGTRTAGACYFSLLCEFKVDDNDVREKQTATQWGITKADK